MMSEEQEQGAGNQSSKDGGFSEMWDILTGQVGPSVIDHEVFFIEGKCYVIELDDLQAHPCRIATPPRHPVEDTYVVYALCDPLRNETFYVGTTRNYRERMRQHCRVTRCDNPHIPRFGVDLLNDRKIEIFDAGEFVYSSILAICARDFIAEVAEAAFIHYYRDTVLNTQINHQVIKGLNDGE